MRVRLEDVCEKESSKLKQSDVIDQNGVYPVYGASGYLANINTYQQSNYYIAVVKDGAGIGRTMLLPPESSIIGTMQYLIPKDNVLPEYLYYVVKAKHLEKYFSGATIPHIYFKDYKNEQFDLVSFDEQREIINRLKKIEIIIENLSKNLLLLDELVRTRFVEMFGDVQDAKKHSSKQLKDICNTVTGGTPSTKHAEYYNGTIPWISTVSLGPNYIDGTTAKAFITQEAVDNSSTKIIPSGSILFGTRVGVGKSSINQVEMCTNQDIVAIIDLDESKYNKLYIKYVLDTYQSYFDSIKKGATILGISSDDLKNIYIPDASLYEQNRFEKFVKQIDKSRSRIQKSLEASQELFDSLMQEYFG
ncbi:restriction endonuclease subunit S [Catenibacterium sp.]|uniref:restriction endonuclease subunit S n=1 Tax=Catenibacterium sp. TaxID=2049022 RepID=UPI003FD88C4C